MKSHSARSFAAILFVFAITGPLGGGTAHAAEQWVKGWAGCDGKRPCAKLATVKTYDADGNPSGSADFSHVEASGNMEFNAEYNLIKIANPQKAGEFVWIPARLLERDFCTLAAVPVPGHSATQQAVGMGSGGKCQQ